jgi:phage-related protein
VSGPTIRLTFAGDAADLVRAAATSGKAVESFKDKVENTSGNVVKSMAAMGAATSGATLLAGGAVAGLGLAVGGLGVKIASENEQVKKSYTGLADHVKAKLTEFAAPFVPVLTQIADKTKATFDRISPSVASMFATAAPLVGKLADGLLKLVENVVPGLAKAMTSAEGPVTAISEGVAGFGEALSKFFVNLSSGADGGSSALGTLFGIVNTGLPILGSIIGKLAEWSGVLIPLALAIGGVALLVKAVTAATVAYEAIMLVVKGATVAWTGVQWALNAAMSANPIGLIIVGIGLLVAAIVWLWNNSEGFRNFFIGAWEAIKRTVSGVGDAIKNAFKSAFNFVADVWNSTVGRLSFTVPDWVPSIGGRNFSAPKIPKFHSGGVVPGAPGSEMLAILQAGERVIPTGSNRGSGVQRIEVGSDGTRVGDALLALMEEAARKQGRPLVRS